MYLASSLLLVASGIPLEQIFDDDVETLRNLVDASRWLLGSDAS